jgi:glycerate kinase
LTAIEAAQAIERGMRSVFHDARFDRCPMADGGEGTVDAFVAGGARRHSARVRGPLGKPVDAAFAMQDDTAIVEMAAASGLGLLTAREYDPLHADTYGTGELLRAALEAGATRAIVGIGGSATNDAGTGMLRALGVRFLDEFGDELDDGIVAYQKLAEIDMTHLDERLDTLDIRVAVDVDNTLCGPNGASRTFGPQKGANEAQVALLDATLERIADVAARTLGRDERDTPGAGAAGGLGFALMAFLRAKTEPGVRLIAKERGLDRLLDGAALCATGEGKIDEQTLHGKTIFGVAELAKAAGTPVVAFGGAIDARAKELLESKGIAVRPIAPAGTAAEDSMQHAAAYLEKAAAGYAGLFERSMRA